MGLNTFRYQFVVPLDPPQTDPSKFEADEDERGTERTTKKNYRKKFILFITYIQAIYTEEQRSW